MAPDYVFRPMSVSDLSTICCWLETPEVVRWWGQPDEQYALVSGDLVRACAKAGFHGDRLIDAPDGRSLLMVRDP